MAQTKNKGIQVNFDKDVVTLNVNDTVVKIAPNGKVVVDTAGVDVHVKEFAAAASGVFNAVSAYGARVELTKNNDLVVYTDGDVTILEPVYGIGEKARDGWRYAGVSETTGRAMFAAPEDFGYGLKTNNKYSAIRGIREMDEQGTKNIRLPSPQELQQIFNNKAVIGRFDELKNSNVYCHYYLADSSDGIKMQNFNDGSLFDSNNKESVPYSLHGKLSQGYCRVRLVRG
jgi:hypothetical protein